MYLFLWSYWILSHLDLSVLFETHNLWNKSKIIADGSSRILQSPPHWSKLTINGWECSPSGFRLTFLGLAKHDSLFNGIYFTICDVNYLPKLQTATNTDLINLSINLFYIFPSKKYGNAVYLLNQQLLNQQSKMIRSTI